MSLTPLADKPIDPGAEFGGPKTNVETLIAFVMRHPDCTLASGEAKMLVDEISRLKASQRQTFIDGAICWAGEQRGRWLKNDEPVTMEEIAVDAAAKFP